MKRFEDQSSVVIARGLGLCMFALMVAPNLAQAAGRTTTFRTDGVTAYDNWIDLTNPADYVQGFVQIYATGSTAQPAYQLFYEVNDFFGSFFNFGYGSIPATSVNFSGGSVMSGKLVVSLDVDTCQLAPSVFYTGSGPCGIIKVTWTEVPGNSLNPGGYTTTIRGSQDIISGSVTRHISGTTESANALAHGSVIGSALSATTFTDTIGLTNNVTVVTESP